MSEANRFLIRAEEIEKLKEMPFQHPLNPNSEIYLPVFRKKARAYSLEKRRDEFRSRCLR